MKIMVFSQYYNPEQFLLNDITRELVRAGHEVTVITGLPNYPTGVIPAEYKKQDKREEVIDGVRVKRCSIIPRGSNKIQLMLNYISYMILAAIAGLREKEHYDLVYLYQLTPILQAFPAILFKRKQNIKLFCYCCDLAPASGLQLLKHEGLFARAYRAFSRWAYVNCDKIGVTSRAFIDYLAQVHGIRHEQMVYIPQHAPNALTEVSIDVDHTLGETHFMFAGNLGKGASLNTILHAAQKLKEQKMSFHVHFVGDGTAKNEMVMMTGELDLTDFVTFHGRVPVTEMADKYKLADVLMVTLRKGQITVPAKLQAYMQVGKPIIGAMDGSGKEMIEEVGCGICVPAEDADALYQAMREYMDHTECYAECGAKGKKYAEMNFSLQAHMDQLTKQLSLQKKN